MMLRSTHKNATKNVAANSVNHNDNTNNVKNKERENQNAEIENGDNNNVDNQSQVELERLPLLKARFQDFHNKLGQVKTQMADALLAENVDSDQLQNLESQQNALVKQIKMVRAIILSYENPSNLLSDDEDVPNNDNRPVFNDVVSSSGVGRISSKQVTIPNNLPEWDSFKFTVHHFLRQFEIVLSAANVPVGHWSQMLRYSCLKNEANVNWVTLTIIEPALGWSESKEAFISRFQQRDQQLVYESQFSYIKQKEKETVFNYANRFESLVGRLDYEDSNVIVINKFRDTLLPHFRTSLLKFILNMGVSGQEAAYVNSVKNSLRSMIDLAIKLEANERSSSSYNPFDSQTGKLSSQDNKSVSSDGGAASNNNEKAKGNHKSKESSKTPNSSDTANNKKPVKNTSSVWSKKDKSNVLCYSCNQMGHFANESVCPNFGSKKNHGPSGPINSNKPEKPEVKSADFGRNPGGRNGHISVVEFPLNVGLPFEVLSGDVASAFSGFQSAPSVIQDSSIKVRSVLVDCDEPKADIVFKGMDFPVALDCGANKSLIDLGFVERHDIAVIPATGQIHLGDAEKVSDRIGITEPLEIFIPHLNVRFEHQFEVLSIKKEGFPFNFLFGRDLLSQYFKSGDNFLIPVAGSVSARSVGVELKIDNSSSVSYFPPNSVVKIDTEPNSEAVTPEEGNPVKAELSTPDSQRIEFDKGRTNVLAVLKEALDENEQISGFCNLPSSVLRLELKTVDDPKLYQRQYKLAHKLMEKAQPTLDKWLKKGQVEPAPHGCRFNNPVTLAPKKDAEGRWTAVRFCLDARGLNKSLNYDDKFPTPIINDLLESLGGNRIFGQFDLEDAYLQLCLHPDSRNYTAFSWKGRQYRYCGCPFGLLPLTGHFQRTMSSLFSDLNFVVPYLDNIIFGSRTWEEHAEHALIIVRRLNEYNLKIKPSSVMVGHAVLRALGRTISAEGVGMDPDILGCVLSWEPPKTGKDLASFLGLVNYVRGHVRHFADLTAKFEQLKTIGSKNIIWTESLLFDFNLLKDAIKSSPNLASPDFSRPFHVAVDASGVGVGGVLFQPNSPDEHITPHNIVAIVSKKLQPHQLKYPAYKREFFGLVYCLRKFNPYIWGRDDLVIITDHKPLTYILNSPQLSPALQQWLDVVMDYRFEIVHRPGILHVVPDALSRMYNSAYGDAPKWGVASIAAVNSAAGPLPEHYHSDLDALVAKSNPYLSVRAMQVNPESSNSPSSSLETGGGGVTIPISNSSHPMRELRVAMEMKGYEIPSDRKDVLKKAHLLGHFGREAIFKRITSEGFWWPNIRKDIEAELKQCDECLKFNVAKQGFHPASFIMSFIPWDHVMIDTSTNLPVSTDGKSILLVVIDVCTGFVILRALPNKEMETIAKELWSIFCLLGLPRILQSDNGTEFVNQVIAAMVKICGLDHRLIAAYNPRADGKVEKAVGTTVGVIKKMVNGVDQFWTAYVDSTQLAFNAKVSSLTNSSPFALMFGRKLNPMKDYSSDPPKEINLEDWQAHQEKIASLILPAINENVLKIKTAQAKRLDKIRRQILPSSFPNGAVVMIKNIEKSSKFDPVYIGPYSIERRARSGNYVLRDAIGDILDRRVPADHIKLVSRVPLPKDEEEPIYVVRKVVNHRGTPGNYEYLVDWKNYKEQTWEPESHFLDPDPVKDYWDKVKK
jgi:hypothetical protein